MRGAQEMIGCAPQNLACTGILTQGKKDAISVRYLLAEEKQVCQYLC